MSDNEHFDMESELSRTLLKLEVIDRDLFRGVNLWKPMGSPRVFGGQVVGQAAVAAGYTNQANFKVHSLHCYFIRPGQNDRPILYHVERTRDGRSFCTRTVKAIQNGECILAMLISFHKLEESPMLYQPTMPTVPPPDDLQSLDRLLAIAAELTTGQNQEMINSMKVTAKEIPLEYRPVNPMSYLKPSPKSLAWAKVRGNLKDADDNIHLGVIAYISDWVLLRTAFQLFPSFRPSVTASLDHSMWFHAPLDANGWMLFETEVQRTGGARALVLGRIWKEDGTLAVTVQQEGVIRGKMVTRAEKKAKL